VSRIDLDGKWRFNLVPRADLVTDGFEAPGFEDAGWAHHRFAHVRWPGEPFAPYAEQAANPRSPQ